MEIFLTLVVCLYITNLIYTKINNLFKNISYKQKIFSDPKEEHELFKKLDEEIQKKTSELNINQELKPKHPIFEEVHPSITSKPYQGYLPYVKRYCLMTQAELRFFKILQGIVQDKYYIVPQVQLSKLVEVEKWKKWEYTHMNRIDRKSVDFVLFDKERFYPYLVIELDDISHLRKDRQIRDQFLNGVLYKAGIRIIHINSSYKYDLEEINKLIR